MNQFGKTKGEKIFGIINVILLSVISFICLYPMLYCVFASLSDSDLLMAAEGALLKPIGFQFDAYVKVLENEMVFVGYRNTLFVLVVGVLTNMVMSVLGAYFLARKNIMYKKVFLLLFMLTMYFSGGLIPRYLTVRSLGLADTLWALILPSAINTYNMIILRTGFASVPESLVEAAVIDGANDLTILKKVFIPLTKATLAVITLYYAVAHWNSWFDAAIFLDSRRLYPLQLVLREILISNDVSSMSGGADAADVQGIALSIQYATIIISTLPILAVYPLVQKYFVSGVMLGSVKE